MCLVSTAAQQLPSKQYKVVWLVLVTTCERLFQLSAALQCSTRLKRESRYQARPNLQLSFCNLFIISTQNTRPQILTEQWMVLRKENIVMRLETAPLLSKLFITQHSIMYKWMMRLLTVKLLSVALLSESPYWDDNGISYPIMHLEHLEM